MKDHNRGYAAPPPPPTFHIQKTNFHDEVILHGSMTTHAMLHGDYNNMQLKVPYHLQTIF
jgi:hypothetical protein